MKSDKISFMKNDKSKNSWSIYEISLVIAYVTNFLNLFCRREERRMHFDGTSFVVRNAGHSAGFDDKNRLKVY